MKSSWWCAPHSFSEHKRTLAPGATTEVDRRALAGIGVGNRHRDRIAHGTAAARRAGQRHRAQAGRHPPLAGRRGRRCAAADSDVQPVPAHEQPGVASDRAGRVAARHRPERRQPHAGAARQRAVQRSVRRLGVLDARAARRGRPHRSRGHVELEPLRQLRDGRRHQHHDGRGDAPDGRRQGAVRQPQQPKVDFRASDVWGKLGLVLDGAAYSTDGYPIVVDVNPAGVAERGWSTRTRRSNSAPST